MNKMNPFDIRVPCINISKSKLLFEQCRMGFNQDKYYIEVQNDDAINSNEILFCLIQVAFNRLDGLYLVKDVF